MRKKIKGYSNYYIYSNGRIQNKKTKKFIKPRVRRDGYVQIDLCNNGEKATHYVHVLVGQSFLDNPENKTDVNHKDGNKQNNNLSNLEYMTRSENVQHAWDTGLRKKLAEAFDMEEE